MFTNENWALCAKAMDMNECDAPESNKTEAGYPLIRSVPMRTSGSSAASSAETWFKRPRLTVMALAAGVEGAGAGVAVAGAFWDTPWSSDPAGHKCNKWASVVVEAAEEETHFQPHPRSK